VPTPVNGHFDFSVNSPLIITIYNDSKVVSIRQYCPKS